MADIRIIPSIGAINVTGSAEFRGTAGTSLLYLSGSGLIGVGTTDPQSELHVVSSGTRFVTLDRSGTRSYDLGVNSSGTFLLTDNTEAADRIAISLSGSVGIGTTQPVEQLNVVGDVRFGNSSDYVRFSTENSNAKIELVDNKQSNPPTIYGNGPYMEFHNGGAQRIRLNSNGTVQFNAYGSGTNTGSAAYSLTVDSSGNIIESTLATVNGSGTANYIPKWSDSDTLTNSVIYETGGVIGIGITTPATRLALGSTQGSGIDFLYDTTNNYKNQIKNYWNSSTDTRMDFNIGRNSGVTPVTVMSVGYGGNVGIGSTAPEGKLNVVGSADVLIVEGSGSTANTTIMAVDGNNGRLFEVSDDLSDSLFSVNTIAGLPVMEAFADNRVVLGAYNQYDLYITGSRVGIGTSAPEAPLHILGNFDANNPKQLVIASREDAGSVYSGIQFERAGGGTFFGLGNDSRTDRDEIFVGGGFGSVTNATAFRVFTGAYGSTVGTERLSILSNGYVGIGTTSPGFKLDVRTGNQGDIASFRGTGYPITFATTGSAGNYYGTQMMMAADSGSTQAAFRLNTRYNSAVGSGVAFTIESSTNDQSYGQNPSALTYSEKFRITQDGNVGIGTASPGYKLQVNGNAKFDSDVYFYNTVLDPASNFATQRGAGFKASTGKFEVASSETALELSRFSTTGPVLSIRHSGSQVSHLDTDGGATFTGDVSIGGDLTVDGIITAKEFHTTFVSASIIYQSGSTQFGDSFDDTHTFRGGVEIIESNTVPTLTLTRDVSGTTYTYGQFTNAGSDFYVNSLAAIFINADSNSDSTSTDRIIKFGNRGSELMQLDASGNLGIGTTSPADLLHIDEGDIRINDGNNGTVRGLYIRHAGITGNVTSLVQDTSGSPRAHLKSSERSLWISAQSDGGGVSTETLRLYNNQNLGLAVDYSGSVGIGTTNPSTILHVYRGGTGTVYDLTLQSGDDSTGARHGILFRGGAANYEALIRTGNYGSYRSNLEFWVSNQTSGGSTLVQALSILSAGDVRLNEYGSGTVTGTAAYNLSVDSTGKIIETANPSLTGTGTANYVTKWSGTNSLTNSVIYDTGTNVGIGNTSPYTKFEVRGTIHSEVGASTIPQILLGSPGLNYGQIQNDGTGIWSLGYGATNAALGTPVLAWNSSGNVGIGITTPGAKLHVVGDISGSSEIRAQRGFFNPQYDDIYGLRVEPPNSGDKAVIYVNRGYGSHKGSGIYIVGANYTNNNNQAFVELNAGSYSGIDTRYIHAYDSAGTDFVVYGDGTVVAGKYQLTDNAAKHPSSSFQSPQEIIAAGLDEGNGLYYINPGGKLAAPIQVYVDFTTPDAQGETGWMLVASFTTDYTWGLDSTSTAAVLGSTAVNAFSANFGNYVVNDFRVHAAPSVDSGGTNSSGDWYYHRKEGVEWKKWWSEANSGLYPRSTAINPSVRDGLIGFDYSHNIKFNYTNTAHKSNGLSDAPGSVAYWDVLTTAGNTMSIQSLASDGTLGWSHNLTNTGQDIVSQHSIVGYDDGNIVARYGDAFDTADVGNGSGGTSETTKLWLWVKGKTVRGGWTDGDGYVYTEDTGSNVGIGTRAPADKLHVQATSGNGLTIITNDVSTIKMKSSTGGTKSWGFATTNLAASDFGIYQSDSNGGDPISAGTAKLYFKSDGNVGIGTTSPDATIHVYSTADTSGMVGNFRRGINGLNEYTYIKVGNSAPAYFGNMLLSDDVAYISRAADPTGGNGLFVQGSGNVGIGTKSPSQRLHVYGGYIKASDDGTTTAFMQGGGSNGYAYFGALGNGPAAFGNSENWTTLVADGGNVGIGSTAPNKKFVVTGAANDEWIATFTNSGTTPYGVYVDTSANSGTAYSFAVYTNAGNGLFVRNNGNVGVGTSSPASGIKLDVSGSVSVAGDEGLRLGYVGDHGAYDNVKITYSGYNGGSPEVIFTPRTTPGSGELTTFFRFKNSNGTASNNNLASVSVDNDLEVGGDLTVDGIITAKEFHTTFVSASIIYQSGSTKFGNSSDDIHYFTGNIGVNVSDPQAPLEVKGASNTPADGNEVISVTNTTGNTKLLLGVAENSYGWIQAAEGSSDRNILLNPNGGHTIVGATSKLSAYGADFTTLSVQTQTGDNAAIIELGGNRTANPGNQNGMIQFFNKTGTATEVNRISSIQGSDVTSGSISFHTNYGGTFSEKVRISDNGDVGIGTDSPKTKLAVADDAPNSTLTAGNAVLDVYGTAATARTDNSSLDILRLHRNNDATPSKASTFAIGLSFHEDPGNNYPRTRADFKTTGRTTDDSDVALTVMSVVDTGRIGVGTTDPTNRITAYQGGGVRVSGIASGGYIEMSGDLPGYSANQYPVIKSGGTIHFANNNKYSAYIEGANTYFGLLDSTTTTKVLLRTSGNSYLNGGNVGIGIAAPGYKLEVAGDARVQSNTFLATDANSYVNIGASYVSTTTASDTKLILQGKNVTDAGTNYYGDFGQILLWSNSNYSASSRRFLITNAHKINQFAIIRSDDATTTPTIGQGGLVSNGTADFIIDYYSGAVGIGQTNPAYKLHVEGDTGIGANYAFKARYTTSDNYHGSFRWAGLQLGNNGTNRIVAGRTGVGGSLDFWVNNTNDASDYSVTPDGTRVLTLYSTGTAGFTGGVSAASFTGSLQGNITGTAASETLATVVARGNSTSTNIRVQRPSNKVDNNGNPTEFGSRVEFNNAFATNESGYMIFRFPTYNNFLISGDYDGNIGGAIPNIQFGRQSTVYMHINSSDGNVGIGTTAPDSTLHVHSSSPIITVSNSDTSIIDGQVIGQVDFKSFDGSTNMTNVFGSIRTEAQGTLDNGVDDGGKMVFSTFKQSTTLVDQMVIDREGNVGIGNTTPTSTLEVGGQVLISATAPLLDFVDTNSFTDTNDRFRVRAGGNEGLIQWYDNSASSLLSIMTFQPNGDVIVPNGNVGIGVTDPERKLEVKSDTTYDGILIDTLSAPEIVLRDRGNSDTLIGTGRHGLDDFHIDTYAGNAFFIKGSSRNVGVGTISPQARFHVSGSILAGDITGAQTSNNITIYHGGGNLTDGTVRSYFELTNPSAPYTNTGDAWNWKLATVARPGNSGNYNSQLEILRSTRDTVTNDPTVVFNRNGNVGIGTTDPKRMLHVESGSMLFSRALGDADYDAINIAYRGSWSSYTNKLAGINVTDSNALNQTVGRFGVTYNGSVGVFTVTDLYNGGYAASGDVFRAGGNGVISFPQYGAGYLKTDANGAISTTTQFTGSFLGNVDGNVTGTAGSETLATVTGRGNITTSNIGIGVTTAPVNLTIGKNTAGSTGFLDYIKIGSDLPSFGAQGGYPSLLIGTFGVYDASIATQGNDLRILAGRGVNTEDHNIRFYTSFNGTGGAAEDNERMRITHTGNIGIGVTSPAAKLDVRAGSGFIRLGSYNDNYHVKIEGGDQLNFRNGASAAVAYIQYAGPADTLLGRNLYVEGNSSGGTTGAVRVQSDGNVGIGNTSPGYKLDVNGTGRIVSQFIQGGGTARATSGTTIAFTHNTAYSANTDLLDAGRFLSIVNESTVTNAYSALSFRVNPNSSGGGTNAMLDMKFVNANNGSSNLIWSFTSGGGWADRMTLTSNGNLGIGSTAPEGKLNVVGGADVLIVEGSGSTANTTIMAVDGNNGRLFEVSDDLSDSLFSVNTIAGLPVMEAFADNTVVLGAYNQCDLVISGSKVGIGTCSPATKLHVQGGAAMTGGWNKNITLAATYPVAIFNSNNSKYAGIGYDYSVDGIRIWTNATSNDVNGTGSERLSIIAGNVGIGSGTPAYKLDVTGTIRATGDVIAYSDARVKENVVTLENSLEKVQNLRGVSYNKIGESEKKIGVIAQEVLEVLPEVVSQDSEGTYSVAYGNITAILIEAIKEQQKQIDELKEEIKKLKG
jgi:hypothetical protein